MELKIVHISVPACILFVVIALFMGKYWGRYEIRQEARRSGAVRYSWDGQEWIWKWETGINTNRQPNRQPIEQPHIIDINGSNSSLLLLEPTIPVYLPFQ